MKSRDKFTFRYGDWPWMTVTVRATSEQEADLQARATMDKRYERKGYEPPVGWTLRRIPGKTPHRP